MSETHLVSRVPARPSNFDPLERVQARWFALAAVLLWLPISVSILLASHTAWVDYLGIALHLAIFMLVAKLQAPEWAKAAGYGYLLLDVTTGVMTLNGVPLSTALYLRLAGHIFCGIWISVASLRGPTIMKIVGVTTAGWLAGYTFVSPFVPTSALGPASVLTLIWLGLIAWQNGNSTAESKSLRSQSISASTPPRIPERR